MYLFISKENCLERDYCSEFTACCALVNVSDEKQKLTHEPKEY